MIFRSTEQVFNTLQSRVTRDKLARWLLKPTSKHQCNAAGVGWDELAVLYEKKDFYAAHPRLARKGPG